MHQTRRRCRARPHCSRAGSPRLRGSPLLATGIGLSFLLAAASGAFAHPADADLPTLAGPAMGTTYRVVLAAEIPGHTRGEVHREIENVLLRLDRQVNTWREDSDASRFNRAAAGEWVEVGEDLMAIVAIARRVHAETGGAFDVTVAPLVRLWDHDREPSAEEIVATRRQVGLHRIDSRPAGPGSAAALRKTQAGLTLDLGGIGPGYGVDCIGERLAALGSRAHLVELGGEARAWGSRPEGEPWRVAVRVGTAVRGPLVELAAGEAIAFATRRPGRGIIDPRTGRRLTGGQSTFMGRAESCAQADALAVARAVEGGPGD